ncbi:type II toxin-antitoxin system HicB family antitoxin [Candidatus Pacearchaeota archaeon]|nr:type II toxin-antitoxin system HicB family antitoxin [Candidatus Pacearchaeota archaeon]
MKIKIVLEEQEEGGYTAYAPSLSGCISQGETIEEALRNIKEAIELYLEADDNELSVYSDNVKTEIITI